MRNTPSAPASALLRRLPLLFALALIPALYLADLTGMGMYGPDEPRYAAIGRAMAATGDLVTPRLWGRPWFEKPALLYWMTAGGFRLGLGPDLAPRLPVALLSLLFLAFFWWRLRLEWDRRAASCATAMLATSVGWLAYSHVAVTDLPMSAFFSAAVLLSLPWVMRKDRRGMTAAAACLGFAALAKGLVPLVLFLPVLAMPLFTGDFRRLGDWLRPRPVVAFCAVALPWYVIVTLRNGGEFLRVFFLEQHFGRFRSAALQHVQPPWFYIPILLLLLFPWFPLLAFPSIAFPSGLRRDPRIRLLAAIVLFGLVFFSASVNKLPGYLLPLLPAAFALLGAGVARAKRPAIVVAPAILLGTLPLIATRLPSFLQPHGLSSIQLPWGSIVFCLICAAAAGAILAYYLPRYAFGVVAGFAGVAFLWLQFAVFPQFNALATSRPLWLAERPPCVPAVSRDVLYGLQYYAGKPLPPCPPLDRRLDQNATRVVR